MKINRENYESHFIDYLDGKLADDQIQEFEAFLLQNPELAEELDGLEKIYLQEKAETFPFKENLKQIDLGLPLNQKNFDFFCIAEAEGDLNELQTRALEDFLKANPEMEKTRLLFKKLKVSPPDTVFENKTSLKKSLFIVYKPLIYRTMAAAAGIALLLAVFFGISRQNYKGIIVAEDKNETEIADTSSVSVTSRENPEINREEPKEPVKILPVNKSVIKKAATTISFKVGIPIASADIPEKGEEQHLSSSENLIKAQAIDTRKILLPMDVAPNENARITMEILNIQKAPLSTSGNDYLRLDEFARQKFTELVFREKEAEITGWGLASAGVKKISDLTGTKMMLEASADDSGTPKKIMFNSKLLSFSTTINREEN